MSLLDKVAAAHVAVSDSAILALQKALEKAIESAFPSNANRNPWKPPQLVQLQSSLNKAAAKALINSLHSVDELEHLKKLQYRPEHWPKDFPPTWASWICAKLLYTLMPADRPVWWVISQPLAIGLTLLGLVPFGVCLVPMTALFLAIDKTDEFQLINLVCMIKAMCFLQRVLLGLVGLVQLYVSSTSDSCELFAPGLTDLEQLAVLTLLPMQLLCWACLYQFATVRGARTLAHKRKKAAAVRRKHGIPGRSAPSANGLNALLFAKDVLPFVAKSLPIPGAAPNPQARGHLVVSQLSASDLAPKDREGAADPKATIALGKRRVRSRTLWKTLQPKWEGVFWFEGTLAELVADGPLSVRLWDVDALSSNDFMGDLDIDLSPLLLKPSLSVRRAKLLHTERGTLSLTLDWEPAEDADAGDGDSARLTRADLEGGLDAGGVEFGLPRDVKGELVVHMVEAENLLALDWTGTSDPYATVKVFDEKKRTRTCPKTLNPEWDQHLLFKCTLGDVAREGKLVLKLWDRDRLNANDFLGELYVDLAPVLDGRIISIIDQPLLGVERGTVTCDISWRSAQAVPITSEGRNSSLISKVATSGRAAAPSVADYGDNADSIAVGASVANAAVRAKLAAMRTVSAPSATVAPAAAPVAAPFATMHGEVRVHMLRASSLLPKDSNGASDPFAIVSIGAIKKRTRVLYMTLDPEWDELLSFEGLLSELAQSPLLVRLWDRDAFSKNDFLGEVAVDLNELLRSGRIVLSRKPLDNVSQGNVTLNVTWVAHRDREEPPLHATCFRGTPSRVQRSCPPDASQLRAAVASDAALGLIFVALLSADVLLRVRGVQQYQDLFPAFVRFWFDVFTLSTSVVERKILWFYSVFGFGFLSAPFVAFRLPYIGPSMLQLVKSGYDRHGKLRFIMNEARMIDKYEREQAPRRSVGKKRHTKGEKCSLV